MLVVNWFFFSSRRRHTRWPRDWSSDVCSSDLVFDYTSASIEAINYRDFDLVSTYIEKDGPRYKEADDYIDYLDSKDIYEEWYGSELEKVEKEDDDIWKVTVIEEFEIIKPDSSDIKKFRTILIIKQIDNEFYVNKLTETNEI